MTPTVAVVIPTYNRVHCLPRALDSVLKQTRMPDQVIVVDDGSSDGTAALLAQHYPRVEYYSQQNRGVSAARNLGIRQSRGQWLAFLDSDDQWLPHKLERQLQAAQQAPRYQLVHCDEIWIRNGRWVNPMNKHRKRGGNIFRDCLARCAISPSAVMVQRQLFDQHGVFDESLPACEDYDLWLRLCAQHPVLYVDELLLRKFGGHADQLSRRHWGMDRFRVQSLQSLLASEVLSDNQRSQAAATLARKCQILIGGAEKRGNHEMADRYRDLLSLHGNPVPESLCPA